MKIRFQDPKLEKLFTEGQGQEAYPQAVFRGFLRAINVFQNLNTYTDLYNFKGLRPEKLTGKVKGYNGPLPVSSVRLNEQFRLLYTLEVEEEKDSTGEVIKTNYILVIEILDYH